MSRLFVDKLTNGVTLGLEFIADNAEDEGRAAIAKKLLAALDGCAVSELLSVLAEAAGSAGDVVDDMRTSGEPADDAIEGSALADFARKTNLLAATAADIAEAKS